MLALVFPALIVLVVMSRAYTDVDGAFVDEWAQAHALTLTSVNRPMVHWYLRTARILRAWGVVAGFLLSFLAGEALGVKALKDAQLLFAFFGYLVGALYAEVALVRPVNDGRRVAALVPREVENYLPHRLVVAQRTLAGAVVVGAAALLWLPFDERSGPEPPSRTGIVVVALVAGLLGLGLERVERWLVHRPQPFSAPELVAADDAIRSQSVHSVAGSGLAALLVLLSGVSFGLMATDVQVLRWTMWLPGLAFFYGSIHVCLYYGHRAWRVRRSVPRPVSA